MRSTCLLSLILCAAACGGSSNHHADAAPDQPDAAIPDGAPDGSPDAAVPDGIAEARANGVGTGLSLAIHHVKVTYLKPQIGSTTNDPAGFTIQAQQMGPALFVAVDPATLAPAPAVGDVVDFTITDIAVNAAQLRVTGLTGYAQVATGTDVGPLVQDLSAATDLFTGNPGVPNQDYDSELITITGTVASTAASSGTGFQQVHLDTTGITGNAALQVRAPTALVSGIDMTMGCHITATKIPVAIFNANFELAIYNAADYTLTGCAAPKVVTAAALSATSVVLTFDRNILPSSVTGDGSQFTFDNGLTASAATVAGKTVTVTTSAQSSSTTYAVTIANTVTDLQGSGIDATATSTTFPGFVTPAIVRINEVNANITGGCDLIELRVVQGGALTGFKVQERTGGSDLALTFPSFIVQKNDFVIIHLNSNSATCNPGLAATTNETVAPNQNPTATLSTNFDTAYDWYSTDTGLVATNNVITVFDPGGAVHDALFYIDVPTSAIGGATLNAANAVGAANQWMPAQPTYDAAAFIAAALQIGVTGTTVVGNSMQRVNDNDTNAAADWTPAATASTWGALNPGQTAFP